MIEMRGVDIDLFQFDWDMTWAGFFLNPDGTIYARFGSRNSNRDGSAELISIASLKKTMQRVLDLHKAYPGNKAVLQAKRGAPLQWKTPEAIPNLAGRWKATDLPRNCIHCHHVFMGVRREVVNAKKPLPDAMLWAYPLPDTFGAKVDTEDGARIASVSKGSAAEKAGLAAGDVLEALDGQAIASLGDIQWALNGLGDTAELKIEVMRGAERKSLTVSLGSGWRRYDFGWRESFWDLRCGVKWDPLSDDDRKKAGLSAEVLGLQAKFVAPQGPAKKAGLQQGDILVAVDGKSSATTESDLLALLRQKYPLGASVALTVLRGGKKVDVNLEMN